MPFITLLATAACADKPPESTAATEDPCAAAKIQAVTLDAVEEPDTTTLREIRDLGATHLALVSFGFQPRLDVPEIRMHTEGRWYSETDDGIRTLARRADTLGLGLILKPHIWVGRYSAEGQARDRIAFESEAEWEAWEDQYRHFLLHYARLAEETGADLLVIGTELAGAVQARPAFWHSLIREVREVYGGALTYAANWYEEYERVSFWEELDYVGVQAYFPLSTDKDPSLAALHDGWEPHLKALRRVHERTGRPILFTEIGYRSVEGAAEAPWQWPSDEEQAPPDSAAQARLYRAFFNTAWPQPWLAGSILWKWHGAGEGNHSHGFSPQGKPAADVIRQGFCENV